MGKAKERVSMKKTKDIAERMAKAKVKLSDLKSSEDEVIKKTVKSTSQQDKNIVKKNKLLLVAERMAKAKEKLRALKPPDVVDKTKGCSS
tara:strand:+ start:422 stop:691 length:270 start_codon:yes stop_codon:yes gene_type:complete